MDPSNLTNLDALLGLAGLLAMGAAVYFLVLSVFTLTRLRHPPRRTYAWAVARGIPGDPSELSGNPPAFETWSFENRGVEFSVWDVTGDEPSGPTVVVTHGWGSCRIDMLNRFTALRPHASRVLLWDMRGHGESSGACTLGSLEPSDLAKLIDTVSGTRAAHEHANENPQPSQNNANTLVLYGYSLGAEVTLKAFSRIPEGERTGVAGVVLEAPYGRGITPAKAVLGLSKFPRLINLPIAMVGNAVLNRQKPLDRWADLTAFAEGLSDRPLLVIHGADDEISPPADGRAIASRGDGECAMIERAGHKDLFASDGEHDGRPSISRALRGFFGSIASSAGG